MLQGKLGRVDSSSLAGLGLLFAALAFFALVVAAEARVVAGLQAKMQVASDRQDSRFNLIKRYGEQRQLTLSALALARTAALIAITSIVVFLMLEALGRGWGWVALAAFVTLAGLTLLQGLQGVVVSHNPGMWSSILGPFVWLTSSLFGLPARILALPVATSFRRLLSKGPEATGVADKVLQIEGMEASAVAIDKTGQEMIRGIIQLDQTLVREVMVPRIDMVAVEADMPLEEAARLMVDKGHSRLPVYAETIDNVVGVVFAIEVLRYLAEEAHPMDLLDIALPPYFVPESKKVDELLAEMRKKKMSIAIVADEYGGTAGLITVEDVVEEIVGEIADEFDVEEREVQHIADGEAVVDGKVSMDSLNDLFGLELPKEDFDTIGGFIYDRLGKMPSVGDEVEAEGVLNLRVLSMLGRRIKKVRVIRMESSLPEKQGNGGS